MSAQLAFALAPRRAPHTLEEAAPGVHPPLARVSDPHTSHVAAAHFKSAAVQNAQILAALAGLGPSGGTYTEIADALGWESVVVARRLAALRQAGHIVRLLEPRKVDGHRPCHVHVAARWAA